MTELERSEIVSRLGDRPEAALRAPVVDDFYPDASFEFRRGWEAAIRAALAAAPSPAQTSREPDPLASAYLAGKRDAAPCPALDEVRRRIEALPYASNEGHTEHTFVLLRADVLAVIDDALSPDRETPA